MGKLLKNARGGSVKSWCLLGKKLQSRVTSKVSERRAASSLLGTRDRCVASQLKEAVARGDTQCIYIIVWNVILTCISLELFSFGIKEKVLPAGNLQYLQVHTYN